MDKKAIEFGKALVSITSTPVSLKILFKKIFIPEQLVICTDKHGLEDIYIYHHEDDDGISVQKDQAKQSSRLSFKFKSEQVREATLEEIINYYEIKNKTQISSLP